MKNTYRLICSKAVKNTKVRKMTIKVTIDNETEYFGLLRLSKHLPRSLPRPIAPINAVIFISQATIETPRSYLVTSMPSNDTGLSKTQDCWLFQPEYVVKHPQKPVHKPTFKKWDQKTIRKRKS